MLQSRRQRRSYGKGLGNADSGFREPYANCTDPTSSLWAQRTLHASPVFRFTTQEAAPNAWARPLGFPLLR
jgi:hypothetical protein